MEHDESMVSLDMPTRLARAVLLFYSGRYWTGEDREEWLRLTGEVEATTRSLCDMARLALNVSPETDFPTMTVSR